MKGNKVVFIITMVIILILSLTISGKIYAANIEQYTEDVFTGGSLPGDDIDQAYCVEPGDAYGLNTWISYAVTKENDAEIEPSVGYAAYLAKKQFGTNNVKGTEFSRAIQEAVWSSDQWGTDKNKEMIKTLGLNRQSGRHFAQTRPEFVNSAGWTENQKTVLNRSFQYGTVYYGLLYNKENIFNIVNGDLKVLVDRIDKTYTVGPYKLTVKDQYKNGFKSSIDGYGYNPLQILYNEIMQNGQNAGYSEENSFAKFTGISGLNGTNAKFINSDGKEIKFPEFMPGKEQDFYIKFNPNDNGAITETGTPIISIKYYTAFKGTKAVYDADSVVINETSETANASNSSEVRTGSVDKKYEIPFDQLKIDNKTINDYVREYTEKNIDKLSWSVLGSTSRYTASIDNLKLQYKLVDNDKVEHTIEFPAKIIVMARKNGSKMTYDGIYSLYAKEDNNKPYQLIMDRNGNVGSLYVTIQKIARTVKNIVQNAVKIETETVYAEVPGIEPIEPKPGEKIIPEDDMGKVNLTNVPVNMQIGGKVWLENPSIKHNEIDGKLSDGDQMFAGIQVRLYEYGDEKQSTLIATTTTDKDGKYRFYGKKSDGKALVNPLNRYYILFTYDGQRYQATYYKQDLSGGYSNAREINRNEVNNELKDIYSDPLSYSMITSKTEEENENVTNTIDPRAAKAYAFEEKIKKANGEYIEFGKDEEGRIRALTYGDIYNEFIAEAISSEAGNPSYDDYKAEWNRNKSYYEILDGSLKSWIADKGVSEQENNSIRAFILETFVKARTRQGDKVFYAPYDRFVLKNIDDGSDEYKNGGATKLVETFTNVYSKKSDMARNVDFGLCLRPFNDLALQKDVFKTKVIVNGKTEEYTYAKKNVNETWDIKVRASDELYNGQKIYRREVRGSEYLLNGEEAYGSEDDKNKNLQVYVTYRIAVKNSGTVNASINEIVDYYDKDQYTYTGAYIGKDADGGKLNDNVVAYDTEKIQKNEIFKKQNEQLTGSNYNYTRLYFSGNDDQPLDVYHGEDATDKILHPAELMFLYVTFKVNNDENGKPKLDQNISNGDLSVGKRNIAEINSYSTYYVNGTEIPDRLENDDRKIDTKIDNDTTPAGLIDRDSAPGSLCNMDLDEEGNIRTDENNAVNNRLQDDTDKSPNIRLIIDTSKEDIRTLNGYVFEDTRDTTSGEATIGDGHDDNGTKINGVTLQLVELVSKVNPDGSFTGEYKGEKVWGSYTFNDSFDATVDYTRYSSGANKSRVIMTGPGILAVEPDTFEGDNGAYSFKSVPAGDFYIRFIYGDNDETVLSNKDNPVTTLVGRKGRNEKSYNGQDYKSTIYQKDVSQDTSYNGIDGYQRISEQNFYKIDDLHVDSESADVVYTDPQANDNKNKMYYYDINNSAEHSTVSDAKDIWDYRQKVNNWSKGADGDKLLNYRAEVLASHEKVATNPADQNDMLESLKNDTFMVAQTGIINTEVEKTRTQTTYERDSLNYYVDHINLGLVERPKAGLKINKEIDNFSVTLSNGKTLFNVSNNQSVGNLYFSQHKQHEVEHKNGMIDRVTLNTENFLKQDTPELLQAYIDDELMQRSTINARYKIAVENVGEVDYITPEFYYMGAEGDEGTKSKTSARIIIDYVSNSAKYDVSLQEQNIWNVVGNYTDLLGTDRNSNYVNNSYEEELKTYDTLLTTEALKEAIVPGKRIGDAKLILSKVITGSDATDSLVYNNLTEIIAVSNDLGRRCAYSIPGNQEMADQSLGNNASSEVYSKVDWVMPQEIDADSAQRIVVMPPTGEVNYTLLVVGSTMAAGLIVGAILLLKKSILS